MITIQSTITTKAAKASYQKAQDSLRKTHNSSHKHLNLYTFKRIQLETKYYSEQINQRVNKNK